MSAIRCLISIHRKLAVVKSDGVESCGKSGGTDPFRQVERGERKRTAATCRKRIGRMSNGGYLLWISLGDA